MPVYAPSIFFFSHYGPRAVANIALVFAINIKVQNAFIGAQQGRQRAINYGPRAVANIALVFAINIKVQNAFIGAQQGRQRAIMGEKKN